MDRNDAGLFFLIPRWYFMDHVTTGYVELAERDKNYHVSSNLL